jgi:uncharacterized protein
MTPTTRRHIAEAAAVTVVTAHNWLSNRRIPAALYVPANVAVAAALIGIGRWGGASADDLGLRTDHVAAGTAAGVAAGALLAGTVVAMAANPRTRHWFADDRARLAPRAAAYETLFRIPLGTALAEELTFRSALLGLSLRHRSWPRSVAWTSALFGLWHVLPTIDTLPEHVVGRAAVDAGQQHHAVGAAVAATAAGGAGLAFLRWATGSVAAPVVVHAMLNATALLTARRHGDNGGD